MWISKVTVNFAILQAVPDLEEVLASISTKKNELRADDTDGHSVPGSATLPDTIEGMGAVPVGTVFERQWQTEASASEFAEFMSTIPGIISATVEQQG